MENKKIVIANWKMSLSLKEAEDLTQEILDGLNNADLENTNVVLCPSFTALKGIGDILKKSKLPIFLGAQNVFWQEKGSYTGEISERMLKELNVKYIIIGHSERRLNLEETDEIINKKLALALQNNFIPILCVGETLSEKKAGQKEDVVKNQITNAFQNIKIKDNQRKIIAYEPVWAIGSGQAVDPREATEMNLIIKQKVITLFGQEMVNQNFNFIYGGSVDAKNAKEFLENKIEGFLIGGASLKSQEFLKIIKF